MRQLFSSAKLFAEIYFILKKTIDNAIRRWYNSIAVSVS